MNVTATQNPSIQSLLEKTATDSRNWNPEILHSPGVKTTLAFLNAHGVNTSVRNKSFYDFLMSSDYLLRDGIGVKMALKLFKLGETENLNGTDLITKIIFDNNNRKLAFFGASDAAVQACRQRLNAEGVQNIAAMENGFHDDGFYLGVCESVKPDIVILCMGMPRQELLAVKLREQGVCDVIICGGGWLDFYSGIKIRAPLWMRKLSLEWLHRLMREPKRLGRRYTLDILYYFYVIARAKLKCV